MVDKAAAAVKAAFPEHKQGSGTGFELDSPWFLPTTCTVFALACNAAASYNIWTPPPNPLQDERRHGVCTFRFGGEMIVFEAGVD